MYKYFHFQEYRISTTYECIKIDAGISVNSSVHSFNELKLIELFVVQFVFIHSREHCLRVKKEQPRRYASIQHI